MKKEYFDRYVEKQGQNLDFHTERMALAVTTEIRRRMQELSLSQEDLAERMQVSPEYVSKLLNYNANLTLRSLAKIGIALDSTWELLQLKPVIAPALKKPVAKSVRAPRKSRLVHLPKT